ncbi:nuclear transport factor 2 family protein [Actinoplanes sp. NBC_00393]|uniref:nuclear transport factor 2 family protein n=1 Tax=Actinoplanes sp. NBC_00393 TaxID=2975953 RepID=UPI002E22975D
MTTENKSIVQRALAGLIETHDVDAVGRFLSDDFTHRRPGNVTKTKKEWLAAVEAALVPLADMQVELLQLLSDGEYVVVHSRRWLPGGPETVVVDVCRLEDGLIVDVWEIIEPVATAAENLRWWE